jgi:hypothetical protein
MEIGTLALIRAGAGRQVCQRFAYLGGNESDWATIREEIARDFRGHPNLVYEELITYCKRVSTICEYLKENHSKEEYESYLREHIPEVRQT